MDDAVRPYSERKSASGSPGWIRRALHACVPAGLHDPVGLARRLLRIKDPAANFAMRAAAFAAVLTPLDVVLSPIERLRYRRGDVPKRPLLFVCGPARSGTTLSAQLLIRNLDVAYFNNLTSIFPRAPLTALSTFGRLVRPSEVVYDSFYGRTDGWSAPNDALYLWDRWLGGDRKRAPEKLAPQAMRAMASFFAAFEHRAARPTLGKNNALNASAHLVAEALPTARFICIERSRVPLALSLLKARIDIQGDVRIPYGLAPFDGSPGQDPVEDVCRQVLFHESIARRQLERLGPERFLVVAFEDVCRDPHGFIERIGRDFLGQPPDFERTDPKLAPFRPVKRPQDQVLIDYIRAMFEWMDKQANPAARPRPKVA